MRTFPDLVAVWVGKRSMRKAASALHVSPNTLGNWLKSRHLPPLTREAALARRLGLTQEQLRTAIDNTTATPRKAVKRARA